MSYFQYQHHVVYIRIFVLCSIPTQRGISKKVCPMFNTNSTWYIRMFVLCPIPTECGISKNICPMFNTNSTWYIYEGLSYVQYQHYMVYLRKFVLCQYQQHVVYIRMFVLCPIPTECGISKNICPMFNTNSTWYI